MLTLRNHDVDDYAALLDMDATEVGVLTDGDRECLNALGDYLISAGAWRRFAVWLLHKHFEPSPGEVFVEHTSTERRQTHTTPMPRAQFSPTGLFATSLRFDTDDKSGLDLVGMEFAAPVDFGSVTPVSPADKTVLAGMAGILRDHGKTDRFGIRLIRDPLGLAENEVLVETCDIDARVLDCEVGERGVITSNIETTWQWEPVITQSGLTPVMECRKTCTSVCLTASGQHYKSGHETSGHI